MKIEFELKWEINPYLSPQGVNFRTSSKDLFEPFFFE